MPEVWERILRYCTVCGSLYIFVRGFDEGFKVLRICCMIRLTLSLCNLVVCSDDSFNARGMEHVYLLANTFLDLIQRDKVLPNSEFSLFIFFTNRITFYFYNTFLCVLFLKPHSRQILEEDYECLFIFLFSTKYCIYTTLNII
jgi:hypothetical protein